MHCFFFVLQIVLQIREALRNDFIIVWVAFQICFILLNTKIIFCVVFSNSTGSKYRLHVLFVHYTVKLSDAAVFAQKITVPLFTCSGCAIRTESTLTTVVAMRSDFDVIVDVASQIGYLNNLILRRHHSTQKYEKKGLLGATLITIIVQRCCKTTLSLILASSLTIPKY